MPKAYPVYDDTYRDHVDVIRRWFEEHAPNVHPVGRNGMHKYNNQDHSMYTAMLHGGEHPRRPPRHLVGERREEYHEEQRDNEDPYRRPPDTPAMEQPLASER